MPGSSKEQQPVDFIDRLLSPPVVLLAKLFDFFTERELVNRYQNVIDPQERQKILAWYERPGWKESMYQFARRLRKEWGLPLEPDIQAAIIQGFIDRNFRNWQSVFRWRGQILEFLQTEVKGALREVATNVEKEWGEGGVVRGLIGSTFGLLDSLVGADIPKTVEVREDQPLSEQIARLMDPYFEESDAFETGKKMCEGLGISIEEGVSLGVSFGFIKRNTIDLSEAKTEQHRKEVIEWLKNDTKVEQALQTLTSKLTEVWKTSEIPI